MKQYIFICMVPILIAGLCNATPVQWSGNGHFYEAVSVPEGISWTDAKVAAELEGSYLATITSATENEFVFELINAPMFWRLDGAGHEVGPWLGGYQPLGSPEPGGNWQWVSGEAWSYAHWASGEPSDSHGVEDRLHFYFNTNFERSSYWNDTVDDGNMKGYIVEYVPEPATLLLLSLGGLMMRKRS